MKDSTKIILIVAIFIFGTFFMSCFGSCALILILPNNTKSPESVSMVEVSEVIQIETTSVSES